MSDEVTNVAAAPVAAGSDAPAPAAAAPAPALDLRSALREVLRKALVYDQLARGLHECAKALDRGKATLCVLAADCEEEPYVRLVEALCGARGINLVKVPEAKQLGEWAGLCKIDKEGVARKVVSCSCVVVREVKEGDAAAQFLYEHFKLSGATLEIPAEEAAAPADE
eukprot:m51a1_g263 putative 40S ribosomal protein S12e (168) ;mRNA; r:231886-232389